MNTTTFSYTEEAFLLSSLHEVVKVWARGSDQASFDLKINCGVAQLTLGFQLGHPASPHCDHPPPQPPFCPHHEAHGLEPEQPRRRRRNKGPARRKRDQLRAEMHNRQKLHHRNNEAVTAVILPFSGKLLPVKNVEIPPVPATTPQAAPAVSLTPEAAPPQVSAAVKPTKSSSESSKNIDFNVVKKQLFQAAPRRQEPLSAPPKKTYQMKEEDLWTKLFSK